MQPLVIYNDNLISDAVVKLPEAFCWILIYQVLYLLNTRRIILNGQIMKAASTDFIK
jgi:hypothetical protein